MASPLVWADVTVQGYWQVQMDEVLVGGERQGLCTGGDGCQVAVDTGTSLLAGPSQVVHMLVSELQVASDCSNIDSLPEIGFVVSGRVLSLTAKDYVAQATGGCTLGLMSLDIPPPKGPLFIFGDPFLRKFYTVYDRRNNRVGFALARHRPQVNADGTSLLGINRQSTHLRGNWSSFDETTA